MPVDTINQSVDKWLFGYGPQMKTCQVEASAPLRRGYDFYDRRMARRCADGDRQPSARQQGRDRRVVKSLRGPVPDGKWIALMSRLSAD